MVLRVRTATCRLIVGSNSTRSEGFAQWRPVRILLATKLAPCSYILVRAGDNCKSELLIAHHEHQTFSRHR
jgi:hypothetical protein